MKTGGLTHTAAILLTATVLAVGGMGGAGISSAHAQGAEQRVYDFDIPARPIRQAMNDIGRVARLAVVFEETRAASATGRPVRGAMTAAQAISILLAGSGLQYRFTNANTVTIFAPAGASAIGAAADGSTLLQPIVIQNGGETGWGPVDGYVASVSASATKTDTPLVETPQSISVVTRDQIEAQGARRLEEALTYTPGVTTGSYGSNPEQDYVFQRGFQVPFLIDGARQYRDYIVGAQVGVEPYGYERIDVLRGPSSVLYGQMAPGGAVNLVSKRPTAGPLREMEITAGYPGRAQAAFDFGGPVDANGEFLYRVTGLGRVADGQMDFQSDDRAFIAPVLTWQPTDDTSLTVFGQFQRDRDALRPVALPPSGTLYPSAYGRIPRDRFLGEPDFDSFKRDQISVGYEFSHRFNEAWSVRQNLRYIHVDQTENVTLVDFNGSFALDGRTVDRWGWHDVNKIGTLGIDNQILGEFDTGPVSHKALFGLDYSRTRSDWFFSEAEMNTIDAFDPVYGSPVGPLVPGISELKKATQVGLYAQDQIAFERWRLTLGGRYDWARGSTEDRLWDAGTTIQEDDAFTGRVGLTYLFDNGLAPYFSYSTSFEPEIGLDSSGNPFEPSTAQQYEVGVKYQPEGGDSFIALSAFDLTKQNILTRDPDAVGWGQIQTGEARVRGIEMEAKVRITHSLDFIGAYTFMDSEITKSNDGNQGKPLFMTPRHQLALWTNYRFENGPLAGLGLGAGLRYRGRMWGSSNEIEVPSNTLVDASVTYDFGKAKPEWDGLRLTVAARNLFDKDYISTCSNWEGCFYGEGRTVNATLKYKW